MLFLDAGLDLGGAEHSLLLLLRGLVQAGVAPVVGVFGRGRFRDRLLADGVPTIDLRVPRLLRRTTRYYPAAAPLLGPVLGVAAVVTVIRIAAVARSVRAGLVHTNGLKVHLLGGVAGRLLGIPVVWHLRDFLPAGLPGGILRAGARLLPRVVVTNSDRVSAAVGRVGRPVVRLYNPVDFRLFHPGISGERVRRDLGIPCATPVVGMLAHLTPWKGHDRFLEIARGVLDVLPQARFVIAGGAIYETDGHRGYAEYLRRRAAELALTDRVVFLGVRDDVHEVLAAIDVLVHCPRAPEPFGRAIAEAMAVGRPVVAARSGGVPELVEDGATGLLVPPEDVGAFAGAVVRLLDDHALREKLGEVAQRRALELFDPDAHARSVLAAYETALRGSS